MGYSRNISIFLLFFLLICIPICIVNIPVNSSFVSEYVFISFSMAVYIVMNIVAIHIHGIDLFEPITIVALLYLFIFFIDPLLNIVNGTTSCLGYNTMQGCKKGTLIFLLSYLLFMIGYYGKKRSSNGRKELLDNMEYKELYEINREQVDIIVLIIWIVSFLLGWILLASRGISFSYFLTLGARGSFNAYAEESSLAFLSNFQYSMITCWVYMLTRNHHSIRKGVCGVFTALFFTIRGFRHTLMVIIIAPIVLYYLRNRKRPKLISVLILLMVLIGVMGVVQVARGALRGGSEVDWTNLTSSVFIEAITGNFDIYKGYYGMVSVVPSQLSYQFGLATIVSTITMVIPRVIWPQKPLSPIISNLGFFCGQAAASAGHALPNIAEYYYDFGVIGCAICMYIFGSILKGLKYSIQIKQDNLDALVKYSVLLPTLLQIILRGYTPSNTYLVFFYLLPVFIVSHIRQYSYT